MRKVKGSISVFLALILTMFLSVVFSFLELARTGCLEAQAEMLTMQAADGLLSAYQQPLLKNYGMLFWQAGSGTDLSVTDASADQITLVNANAAAGDGSKIPNYALLDLSLDTVDIEGYALATDAEGAPFRKQAVMEAKQELTYELMDSLKELLSDAEGEMSEEELAKIEEEAGQALEQASDADAAEPAEGEETPEPSGGQGSYEGSATMKDNPVTWLKKVKKSGVLALVTSEENLSDKSIDTSGLISNRSRNQGTLPAEAGETAADKIWFRLFLQQKYSSFTDGADDGPLDYEMEYLLGGKDSDRDNLKAAVRQLLLMREGVNYLYLLQDGEKSGEALAMALAITGAVGLPELAEPLKHGILLAWAYAESISDVRILMSGGKVLPVKTAEQWHTDLEHLGSGASSSEGKKQKGLSYEQYLLILLGTRKDPVLTFRAMDLIEKKENVRMDHMVVRLKCTYHFSADPLFWSFVALGDQSLQKYQYETAREFGYDSVS